MTKEELRALAAKAVQGATVTKVPEGAVTLDPSDKAWAQRVRDPNAGKGDAELIAERHTVVDHMGRERVRNGLGEWVS